MITPHRHGLAALTGALGLCLSPWALPASALAAAPAFHVAATAPEKALDGIIRLSERDPDFFTYITRWSWSGKPKDKGYSKLLTTPLLKAIANEEKRLVKENCGGKYISGDLCGHGASPISCTQDMSDGQYLYKTAPVNTNTVQITYRWPEITQDVATYRLVFDQGRWTLDGISCTNGSQYN